MYLKGTYYARHLMSLIWHLSWQRTRDWFFGSNLYNCGITWTDYFQSSDKNGIFFRCYRNLKVLDGICFKIYCSNTLIAIYLKLSKNSENEDMNYLLLLMKINALRDLKNDIHNRDSFSLIKHTFLNYYIILWSNGIDLKTTIIIIVNIY